MLDFLKRSPLQHRLLAPLYSSFLLLIGIIIIQGCLSFLLESRYQRAVQEVSRSLLVKREGARLLGAALDEQTSLRGYLLTSNPAFLEPYRMRAQTAFQESFDQLYALTQEDPTQLKYVRRIREIYDNWQIKFARRVLAGTASKITLPGKTLFDPMREQLDALLKHEDQVLQQRNQNMYRLSQMKFAADFLGLLTILIGVIWNVWLLHHRVELPLQTLTSVSQTWRSGQLDMRLNYSSPDEMGRLAAVLDAMAHEIRDRQRRTQHRNQQLEDLISALSHDLRTPLLATRATLRPMLNGAFGPVSDTWREVLEEYRQSNETLLKLVETLLDVSRYEFGGSQNLSHAPLDWKRILTQAETQIQASFQQKCPITIAIGSDLPIVYGDPLEIQRVVQNLLDNAVRVSEQDQPITLEVTPFQTNQVRVAVTDRGPGIALAEKERLFHRFMQGRGRRGGAGLGLYLCRQIVEAHGGTIHVESQLGQGSTFWFLLPMASLTGLSQETQQH